MEHSAPSSPLAKVLFVPRIQTPDMIAFSRNVHDPDIPSSLEHCD